MTIHNDKPITIAEIKAEYRNRVIATCIYRIVPQWERDKYTVFVVGTRNQFTVTTK